jgi:hypothetical protein
MFQTVNIQVLGYCSAEAVAPPSTEICEGESVTLDGSGSSVLSCTGDIEYRWLEGATVVSDWSGNPEVTVTPADTGTYTLEVRCSTDADCSSSDTTQISVFPYPTAFAGDDLTYCQEDFIDLDAGGSSSTQCPFPLEYRWRKGATVVRDWSANPVFRVAPPEEDEFQVDVRCPQGPECVSTDAVRLIEDCPLAVKWAGYGAKGCPDGVTVYWSTLAEIDTLVFAVERTENPGDPAVTVELGYVPAYGRGHAYEFIDRDAKEDPGRFYYRVVEITAQGSGDKTSFFKVRDEKRTRGLQRNRSVEGDSRRREIRK